MPTLTIEGRRVRVGDEFTSMSAEQQAAAVEEIAGSLGIKSAGGESPAMKEALSSASKKSRDFFGENSGPPEGTYRGVAMNATAGINEGIYGLPGYLVDGMAGAMNLGIRGANAVTGSEIPMIDDPMFGSRHLQRMAGGALGEIHPALNPENTKAQTTGERIARSSGEAVGSSVTGAGIVGGLSRAGMMSAPQAEVAANLFGRASSAGTVAGEAAVSGAAGAGASAAAEAAPDQFKPVAALAGGLVSGGSAATVAGIPGAVRGSARIVSDVVAPMTRAGQERLAATRLRNGASDPSALRSALDAPEEIVAGSMPTTGQLTGDMGILAMERAAATRWPEVFMQRRSEQNSARLDALEGVQPAGAPETVAAAVRQRLDAIDRSTQAGLDVAQGSARARTEALGQGMAPEVAGDAVRSSYEAARAAAKAEESRLWTAVDPDGSLVAPVVSVRQAASDIIGNSSRFADMSDREAGIYRSIADVGDALPFSEFKDLRTLLNGAMREERQARGETLTFKRLSTVRSALERDLDAAISGKAAQEAEAVAAGTMRPSETLLSRIEQEQAGYLDGRSTRARSANGGVGAVSYGASGPAPVPGAFRTGGQAQGGFGDAAGNPRLAGAEPLSPNIDEAARDRLRAATTATRERVETFDNKTLSPMRRRPSSTAPYDMASAAVMGRLFFPGTKSPEALATLRNAVQSPEAMQAVEAYAVDRLRRAALRDDGTLDPAKVASWRRSHADALRAVPDLDARLADAAKASETMATIARARKKAIDDAQAGALGRVLGAEDPSTVTNIIGGIFARQDGVAQMSQLRKAIAGDPEAEQGLRKAVANFVTSRMVGNTESATSGRGVLKSDSFQTFIKRNRSVLAQAGFKPEELDLMGRIAEDLQRAGRSDNAVRIPSGSNTAQDLLAVAKNDRPSVFRRLVSNLPAAASGVGGFALAGGGALGVGAGVLGAAGAKALADMRAAGFERVNDIVADALLHPERARLLLAKPTSRGNEEGTMRMLSRLYGRSAGVSAREMAEEERQR